MTYIEATDFLFTQLPMFQNIGAGAYKPGLGTTLGLAARFGNPHLKFPTIHVAGTNGKGSTAHSLAAVLQKSGYRTGLFTSPHLVDFRERIRVDGAMIPEQYVSDFVDRFRSMDFGGYSPSFFELTTVMAFEYFAKAEVDVAVIEVGLGGRLDSTNIITPVLSVITNISFDHTALLGGTLEQIASEKAGIIKTGVPVVVGEAEGGVRDVFAARASAVNAPVIFASEQTVYSGFGLEEGRMEYRGTAYGTLRCDLTGDCQPKNFATVLCSVEVLRRQGWKITPDAVRCGLSDVCGLTGLAGRWMVVGHDPLVICDTGHNEGGWRYIAPRLKSYDGFRHLVIGFVNDKEIDKILNMMPRDDTRYYFTQASVRRALSSGQLRERAMSAGLNGEAYPSVSEAYDAAYAAADKSDIIFVGGSTFVVADFLATRYRHS